MTVQEFLDFFNGIYCDYDGAYGDQCFDLANGYSRWIGGPRFTGATADLIINQAGTFYTRIDNGKDNFPQKGDVVVWKWPHVGVATGNNTDSNKFEALEQNDPTNSDCHLKEYNYNGVLGWLRPNKLPQEADQKVIDELRAARDKNWNLYQTEVSVNNDLKQQIQAEQQTSQKLRIANDNLTAADANTGAQLLDAQHAVNDFIAALGLPAGTSTQVALDKITGLLKPHEDMVKQVQPTLDALASAAIMKRAPKKTQSLLDKLKSFFKL